MEYLTSDLHISHANIIKYDQRPFKDIEEHDNILISNWNSVVNPDDTIYVIGDFMMGHNFKERLPLMCKRLMGKIVLIRGNHDRKPQLYLDAGFEEVHDKLEKRLETGELVLMQHHPPTVWLPEYDKLDYLLHGHVHLRWKNRGKAINVGTCMWDYAPKTLAQLVAGLPVDSTLKPYCINEEEIH